MAEWVPVARLIVTDTKELKGSALRWPLFIGAHKKGRPTFWSMRGDLNASARYIQHQQPIGGKTAGYLDTLYYEKAARGMWCVTAYRRQHFAGPFLMGEMMRPCAGLLER